MIRSLGILCMLAALVCATEARAGGRTVLALIVTNNRSSHMSRPDLRYADDDGAKDNKFLLGLAGSAIGAAMLPFGIARLRILRPGEKIYRTFEQGLSSGRDPVLVLDDTEQVLYALRNRERRIRIAQSVMGWVATGLGIGLLTTVAVLGSRDTAGEDRALLAVGAAAITGLGFELGVSGLFESPIERMVRMWSQDPATLRLPKPQLQLTPQGGVIGVGGRF